VKARITRWLRTLSAKYIALFVLLVAVPAIGISIYLLDSSYNDNKRALIQQHEQKAQALADTVSRALDEQAHRLGSLHAEGVPPELLMSDILLPMRVEDPNILSLAYVDEKGRERVVTPSNTFTNALPTGLDKEAFFVRARSDGVYFGPLQLGPLDVTGMSGGPFQDCACELSIAAADNYGHGVFLEKYGAGDAFPDFFGNTVGHTVYAYAITADGKPISYPNRGVFLRIRSQHALFKTLPQVRRALTSKSPVGSATGHNFGGTSVLSAWATVQPVGWKVFVEQPESAAFAPLSGKIWRTGLLIAAFVLVAVALSILLARRLVRPIKRLRVAAEAIGAGAYDERIELDRRDELGALASAFNVMAEHVHELIEGLERKVAERTRALEVASKHKSEFLANMSHELRTPLNAIVGFSQVLGQKLFGEVNQKQEEYLDDILSSADHLLSLINDILDLSKVEAGQVELEVGLFSLREALERGVVMVRERALKNGVQLQLELDPSVDLVEGDERRIRQVVFNLLSNAVKFTPNGGRVDVSTSRQNGQVLVAVADTGPGIAPSDQERIFEEFQQAHAGDGERTEGTGLGLALSRSLVELHGGRIWVDSEPGRGATFTFTLPVGSRV
jgi:signal transduction histidine kinase